MRISSAIRPASGVASTETTRHSALSLKAVPSKSGLFLGALPSPAGSMM